MERGLYEPPKPKAAVIKPTAAELRHLLEQAEARIAELEQEVASLREQLASAGPAATHAAEDVSEPLKWVPTPSGGAAARVGEGGYMVRDEAEGFAALFESKFSKHGEQIDTLGTFPTLEEAKTRCEQHHREQEGRP